MHGGNSSNIGGARFRVYQNGNLVANNATISGTINSAVINGGAVNSASINGSTISNGNGFYVDANGNVTANSININGGSISNTGYSYASGGQSLSVGQGQDGLMWSNYNGRRAWMLTGNSGMGMFISYENGSARYYYGPTGAYPVSDIRYKKDIEYIDEEKSINIINGLNPIVFTYIDEDNARHRGLSAQEVEKVLKENGYENQVYKLFDEQYAINYTELIPDLINSIKYLKNEIEELKKEIEKLKGEK